MKLYTNKKYNTIAMYVLMVVAISLLMVIAIFKLSSIVRIAGVFIDILMPVIWGLAFAYILNPIMKLISRLISKYIFKKKKMPRLTKGLSVGIVSVLFVGFIVGMMYVIIPALFDSLAEMFNNFESMFLKLQEFAKSLFSDHPDVYKHVASRLSEFNTSATELIEKVQPMLNNIVSGAWGFVSFVKDFVLGFIVSVYLVYSKDNLLAQCKKILLATFKKRSCKRIFETASECNKVFSGFLTGKVLDSIIIGFLAVPFLLLLDIPYAVMIAVVIGVTNVIPFFGPIIGAIPTGLLVLLVEPRKVIPFIIFVILLQQFDGNILGPKILGDSTGLPAIWVMISLFVGGGLFGFAGMILAVPTFAVIYGLTREYIEKRLRRKKLPVETSYYTDNIEHLYSDSDKKRIPPSIEELEKIKIPPAEEVNEIEHKDLVK